MLNSVDIISLGRKIFFKSYGGVKMSEAMSRADVALGNDELWHPQGTPGRRNSHLIKEEDNGRVAVSDE